MAVSCFGSSRWSTAGERLRRCVQAGATTGEHRPPEAAEMGICGGGSASDADRVCPSTADLSSSSLPQPHSFELARGQSQRHTEPGAHGCTRYNRCERCTDAATWGEARKSRRPCPLDAIARQGHRGLPSAFRAIGREGQRNPGSDRHRLREMFHVEPERAGGRHAPRRAGARHPIRTRPGPLTLRCLTPGPVSPRHRVRIGRPHPAGLPRSLRRPHVSLRCGPPPVPGAGARAEPRP